MTQRSLIWPLALVAAFAVLLIMLMVGSLPAELTAQAVDCASVYPTPGADRDNCNRTATAQAGGSGPYPSPSSTSAPAQPATATISATVTTTATLRTATPTQGPTNTATLAVTRPPQSTPTASPTSTLVGLETLQCLQGSSVTISGTAAPNTALLAYFNERPVGGALSRPDGSYLITLRIGEERPGLYPVSVRLRDSRDPVRELACEVPGGAVTPTLEGVPAPRTTPTTPPVRG